MKQKIAFGLAMIGIIGLLGLATAALADGVNTNGNTNSGGGNTNVPVTQISWGQLKCIYSGKYTRDQCLGTKQIADPMDNKNSE